MTSSRHEWMAAESDLPEAVPPYSTMEAIPFPAHLRSDVEPESKLESPGEVKIEPTHWQKLHGLSRKTRWIAIGATLLVVIAALVGGLAGGLSQSPSSNKTANPENNTSPAPGPFLQSQLAAVNWTDDAGEVRRAVFYQRAGHLLASLAQDSNDNMTWAQVNISAQLDGAEGWAEARSGTPLAASAVPWQGLEGVSFAVALFYLDDNNLVRQVITEDFDIHTWTFGPEWNSASTHAAGGNTQLAAVGYYCPRGCFNSHCVIYQDADRAVYSSCGVDWEARTYVERASAGSPLAVIPYSADDGRNVTVSELRLFYYTDTDVRAYFFNHRDSEAWEQDPVVIINSLEGSGPSESLPQIVASPYESHSRVMVLATAGNAQVRESYYTPDDFWITDKQINISNENGTSSQDFAVLNVSAIALDHDHRLSGVTEGGLKIVQFVWSTDSPLEFRWMSDVVSG
ncbi:hypothetical protein GGR57DRAFT_170672 [Xylariaceae sp. FL1272]|nr:hypothetical protein GGR57DRAFT_170672 [Xylariaceae sp. FL1272]